jgi:hypothetical protein
MSGGIIAFFVVKTALGLEGIFKGTSSVYAIVLGAVSKTWLVLYLVVTSRHINCTFDSCLGSRTRQREVSTLDSLLERVAFQSLA